MNQGRVPYSIVFPAITDLHATSITDTSVTLFWSAPAMDGHFAKSYDLRYQSSPPSSDTTSWWKSAMQVDALPEPSRAGIQDSIDVPPLSANISYYFMLRAGIDFGSWSGAFRIWQKQPH